MAEQDYKKKDVRRLGEGEERMLWAWPGWWCMMIESICIMSDHFEAACLCGKISLSYSGGIGPANYCHCEDCRRVTGSAFNIGVRVERKHLKVTASTELRSYKGVSGKGREIERCFCGTCGSPIYTLHADKPDFAWVKAGIINDSEMVKPAFEIWTKDKVPWATIKVAESYEENRPS
jgi:hypothetical protein